MFRTARLGLIPALLLMSVLVLGLSLPAAAQGIVFREVGSLHQQCPADESVYYEWFIYNDSNTTYLVEISVEPASGSGWSSEISQSIFVSDPGEVIFANLTVSASSEISAKTVNQTVTFKFTDLVGSTGTFNLTSTTSTDFVTSWSVLAPGKNKLLGYFDNPLPPPFDSNYVTFVLNICVWIAIALFVMYVVEPMARLFTRRTKTDIDDRILKILHKPIFLLLLVYGVVSSLSILRLTDKETRVLYEIYGAVLIVVLTFVIYRIYKEVLIYLGKKWAARTKTEIDNVLIPVIDKIGGLVILVFGAVAILDYMGYNITFLLAGVGVMGLVIAFAAQDALSNFISGIFLMLDRPFAEGEYILISSGELCRVERIGIRSTRLYDTVQNSYIILPNNKLVNDKIVNLEEPDEQGKAEVTVGVAYGSDVEKVERILLDAAKANRDVLKDVGKEPIVRFTNFGESSLQFSLTVWVANFMDKWRVAHELRKAISARFLKDGIETPFPPRAVILKEQTKK